MHAPPERPATAVQRNEIEAVGRLQEACAGRSGMQMAVLPNDPLRAWLDDDEAVVVVVVDRDVSVRKPDRERRMVERAPARRGAVVPEDPAVPVHDHDVSWPAVVGE